MDRIVSNVSPQQLCNIALGFHERGDFNEAARLYLQVLGAEPVPAQNILFAARHMLGIIRHQQGRHQDALELIGQALQINPNVAEVRTIYGLVLRALGRAEEALEQIDRALSLNPRQAKVWSYRGALLWHLKRPQDAMASFDEALSLDRNLASAWSSRGEALHGLGQTQEALASLQNALALDPVHLKALSNIGEVLCESNRIEEGFAMFRRHAELKYGAARAEAETPAKLRHDEEQSAYLGEASILNYRAAGGERVNGPAINPKNANAETARAWQTAQPQVMVLDDFLSVDALEGLRNFCWGSTVWRKSYDDGYLGAMPEHGFACPLLAQIAQELSRAFPVIFGDYPLCYLWAFKYDQKHSGIKLHGDMAAVNVNFWITPDEANNNPERGGMVIWDVAAPADWDFQKYNGDIASNRDFVERNNAKPLRVPYKANRAVIFDSDLFHETDEIDFKDGYLNRRINVTLLYGRRQTAKPNR